MNTSNYALFYFFITARVPAVDFRDKCDKLFSIISLTTTKSTFKLWAILLSYSLVYALVFLSSLSIKSLICLFSYLYSYVFLGRIFKLWIALNSWNGEIEIGETIANGKMFLPSLFKLLEVCSCSKLIQADSNYRRKRLCKNYQSGLLDPYDNILDY